MSQRFGVPELRRRIMRLPADPPVRVPGVWYLTQKEHWLGWLRWYDTAGAYGRRPRMNRDARFAYNHIVCAPMLEWLIRTSGEDTRVVSRLQRVLRSRRGLHAQSASIRRLVPFERVVVLLWPESTKERTVEELLQAIRRRPIRDAARAQWIAWLRDYETPGYYQRQVGNSRDARFADNHLHNAAMLVWLARLAGVDRTKIARAERAASRAVRRPAQAAAVRRHLPWKIVDAALWR